MAQFILNEIVLKKEEKRMDFTLFIWAALTIDVILIGYGQAQRFGNSNEFLFLLFYV